MRRVGGIAVVVAVLLTGTVSKASAWDSRPLKQIVTRHRDLCGRDDLPEGAIQGDVPKVDQTSGRAQQGYNCGLALLGYTSLGQHGRPNDNANMAWAGHCAYISSASGTTIVPQVKPTPPAGAGVAVVSVSDAGKPTYVGTLRHPGGIATSETINAVTTPGGRSILVVGQYGNDAISDPKPMDVYDVSNPDCGKFKYLTTYYWPTNIHNLTISPGGRYVYATLPLQAVDINGLFDNDPRTGVQYLGNIQQDMNTPLVSPGPVDDVYGRLPDATQVSRPLLASHEAWPSPDNKTLYVGSQTAEAEIFAIVDISKWLQRDGTGQPLGPPRVISQRSGRGHSVRLATIHGRKYVLHSEESVASLAYGCLPQELNPFAGPAQPWLTDITNPADPRTVSQFGLEINEPRNCLRQLEAGENDSVHYHDVDDATDTTFVMASMWNAGIRVFDVRNPRQPTEVAYFNPGDVDPSPGVLLDHAWGHVRWIAKSHQLWFATAAGGFFVVRMENQVLRHLGMSGPRTLRADVGRPGTLGAVLPKVDRVIQMAAYYCTLSPVTSLTSVGRP